MRDLEHAARGINSGHAKLGPALQGGHGERAGAAADVEETGLAPVVEHGRDLGGERVEHLDRAGADHRTPPPGVALGHEVVAAPGFGLLRLLRLALPWFRALGLRSSLAAHPRSVAAVSMAFVVPVPYPWDQYLAPRRASGKAIGDEGPLRARPWRSRNAPARWPGLSRWGRRRASHNVMLGVDDPGLK